MKRELKFVFCFSVISFYSDPITSPYIKKHFLHFQRNWLQAEDKANNSHVYFCL